MEACDEAQVQPRPAAVKTEKKEASRCKPPNLGAAAGSSSQSSLLLAVGPFANSLWTKLQLRCTQHVDDVTADIPRGTSLLLGMFGKSSL